MKKEEVLEKQEPSFFLHSMKSSAKLFGKEKKKKIAESLVGKVKIITI